ncbi:MAG: LytR/AlgR family response regulator transcription factor [Peptostreptococcaceae bacterium]
MKLHIGVCDDISLQRNIHKEFINKFFSSRDVEYEIHEFSCGEELLEKYPKKLDILFLDIIMEDMTGMDVSKHIREFDKNVEILFITSSMEYIQEGYEVRAYRYLMKPITYEMMERHLEEWMSEVLKKKEEFILLDTKNGITKIMLEDIRYIETDKRELIIYQKDRVLRVKMSMKNMEKILEGKFFFRCHTSYIVNLKKVEVLQKNNLYIEDKEIPISKYVLREFKIKLTECLGEVVC